MHQWERLRVWINSNYQRLSTSSEAVLFSYSEIYAWTFKFLSYFTEKSQNRVDNTLSRAEWFCARDLRVMYYYCTRYTSWFCWVMCSWALLSVAYVCALKCSSAFD